MEGEEERATNTGWEGAVVQFTWQRLQWMHGLLGVLNQSSPGGWECRSCCPVYSVGIRERTEIDSNQLRMSVKFCWPAKGRFLSLSLFLFPTLYRLSINAILPFCFPWACRSIYCHQYRDFFLPFWAQILKIPFNKCYPPMEPNSKDVEEL